MSFLIAMIVGDILIKTFIEDGKIVNKQRLLETGGMTF